MEIEVKEWVRLKDGRIRQFKQYVNNEDIEFIELTRPYNTCKEKDIVKHNKDIKKLIEEGDYVNGYRVEQVSIETNEVLLDHNGFGWRTLKDGDKIVTHEQFESIEYKVKVEG